MEEKNNQATQASKKMMNHIIRGTQWPGKRHAFRNQEIRKCNSVFSYETSFLFDAGHESEETPVIGFHTSQKFGRNIPYFSAQEKQFIELIELTPEVTDVIEKPVQLLYDETYGNTFVPDYLFFLRGGRGIIVMLMPYDHFSSQTTQRKWYALEKYCAENGYGCVLYDLKKDISLKWLLSLPMSETYHKLEDKILTAIKEAKYHWLKWMELREIMKECKANTFHFHALVLRQKLHFVPKSSRRKLSLLGATKDDLFDSKLVTTTYKYTAAC